MRNDCVKSSAYTLLSACHKSRPSPYPERPVLCSFVRSRVFFSLESVLTFELRRMSDLEICLLSRVVSVFVTPGA